MGIYLDGTQIKIYPLNTVGRVKLFIGSKSHSLTPEDLMRVRDAINRYLFFETEEGVESEDYVPSGEG